MTRLARSIIVTTLAACAVSYIAMSMMPDGNESHVTVGTFNIEWLGDGVGDSKPRTDHDYLAIADIIAKTGADVLGVQEIENKAALHKVLRYLKEYDGFIAAGTGNQHVGIVYRKSISIESVGEYQPLVIDSGRNRPGLIVRAKKGNFDWLMMVVHLKSTSRFDSTTELRTLSRVQRTKQAEMLRFWSDSVITSTSEKDVVIVGDFNDSPMRKSNATLTSLSESENVKIITSRMKSCRSPQEFGIDHIVLSRSIAERYIEQSERYEDFRSFLQPADADQVSDHCPLVVKFRIAN